MPTSKARGKSLHVVVAQDIGARILRGEFAPGTLLPNEAEWCRVYKVSRTAVREAIKTLSGKGMILSRPKIGSRVEPRTSWNLLDRDVLDAGEFDEVPGEILRWHRVGQKPSRGLIRRRAAEAMLFLQPLQQ